MYIIPLLLIVGCSGAMQDFGKRLVVGRVADEFDLDVEQRKATRASVDRLVEQAPEVLGPRVEIIFEAAENAISDGFPDDELISIEGVMDGLFDDAMAPLLSTLDDEQIDHFAARSKERLEEARDKLTGTPTERLEKRQDHFIEEVGKWTGPLDEDQERALREHVRGITDEGGAAVAAQEARSRGLVRILKRHPGTQAIRDALWNAWETRDDWGPESRSRAERSAESRETLRIIDGLLRPKQRDAIRKHLHSLHDRVKAFLGTK